MGGIHWARSIPGHYGRNPTSYLIQIQNDNVHIIDSLSQIGMVTAAAVGDINKDGWSDLIIGGEWQPIRTCLNDRGKINWEVKPLPVSNGWWRNIQLADIDQDGDIDIIAGNHGLNSQYRGNETNPLLMHVNDFDKNGSTDIAINTKYEGKYTPIATRANMVDQMPYLKKRYNRTKPYSIASMEDVFDSAQLASSLILMTNEFNSCVFINEENQGFSKSILPIEAQYSSANGILIKDINRDNLPEIILAGNTYAMEIETGQNDAGTGLILENRGKGYFKSQTFQENGFFIPGDVKCFMPIEIQGKFTLIAAKNGDRLQVMKLKNDK
ncbi:MAG: FG-GAP repeat protein [Bacteroidetes bacterium]|nr:FG-GAP repeat protein [Bacteroidota bacterium]